MNDIRLEVIESTIGNISEAVIKMKIEGIEYTELSELDKLLDEWACNIVEYNRTMTKTLGFKVDKSSTKTKELHKLVLIDKYNDGTIHSTIGGRING